MTTPFHITRYSPHYMEYVAEENTRTACSSIYVGAGNLVSVLGNSKHSKAVGGE